MTNINIMILFSIIIQYYVRICSTVADPSLHTFQENLFPFFDAFGAVKGHIQNPVNYRR